MKLLSLDLDFFLDNIGHDTLAGESDDWKDGRLIPSKFHPWSIEDTQAFLERKLKLDSANPTPGRTGQTHDMAFRFWDEMIRAGRLNVPFDLVHVDGHADLGIGEEAWKEVGDNLLRQPVQERPRLVKSAAQYLSEGSYLLYALACRWVRSVTFVPPEAWFDRKENPSDLPALHFKNLDPDSGAIQLKRLSPAEAKAVVAGDRELAKEELEPEVPFTVRAPAEFELEGQPEMIFFSHSPGFTPPTADDLIPLVKNYIQEL